MQVCDVYHNGWAGEHGGRVVFFHPSYAQLSESAQSAVAARLITGSRTPTGSMLGDMVVEQSRWMWEPPASNSSLSSVASHDDSGWGGLLALPVIFGIMYLLYGGTPSTSDDDHRSTTAASQSVYSDRDASYTRASHSFQTNTIGDAIVNYPGVNLRSCASTQCDIITALRPGTKVTIRSQPRAGWLDVDAAGESGQLLHGNVSASHVSNSEDASYSSGSPSNDAPYGSFRQMPAASREIFRTLGYAAVWTWVAGFGWTEATLVPGTKIQPVEFRQDGWAEVIVPVLPQTGRRYIRSKFLGMTSKVRHMQTW